MTRTLNLPNNWRPRGYQLPLWRHFQHGGLRGDVAWHRRAGKDDVGLNWAAVSSVRRVGNYWHMLPEASQARKAIWDAVNPHTGKRRIDEAFPSAIRAGTRENDMMIRLVTGSTWQVVGSDNFNSLVGSAVAGVTFSEWSLSKPAAWGYLQPILAENRGWALKIWTPRGRNHATRAFEAREAAAAKAVASGEKPEWFTQRLSALDTGVFTAQQLATARQEMIDETGSEEEGDAKYRQEYLVDFDAAVPGSYYGAGLALAQAEGRVGFFPYNPALPVITAWDIGVDDYTAIWFFQEDGRRVWAIEYYETTGEGAEAIVKAALPELNPNATERADALQAIGRTVPYRYGGHHLPHDVRNREWGAGAKTRYETLVMLGVKPIQIGVAQNPADRINAMRRLMPAMHFDSARCAVGLDRLRNYRRSWNKALSVYGAPLHDENSHGSDAAGEFAINCRILPATIKPPPVNPPDLWARKTTSNGWKVA